MTMTFDLKVDDRVVTRVSAITKSVGPEGQSCYEWNAWRLGTGGDIQRYAAGELILQDHPVDEIEELAIKILQEYGSIDFGEAQ